MKKTEEFETPDLEQWSRAAESERSLGQYFLGFEKGVEAEHLLKPTCNLSMDAIFFKRASQKNPVHEDARSSRLRE